LFSSSSPRDGQGLPPTWRGLILKISLVAALVVAAVVSQVAYDLWRSHDRQLSNAERDTANLVRLLDEQTARTFQAVDLSMRAAADAISRLPDDLPDRDRAIHEMLVSFMPQLPFVRSLYIVDRAGVMRYLSNQFPAEPLDNRARDYFKDLSAAPRETLYIGKPVLSRVSGRWFISAGLRLNDAAGNFDGVILAAVEPDYFQAFYRSLDVGEEGRVALYLADGSLLIGSPHDDSQSGASFADRPLFQEHLPAASQGVFHAPAIGAEPARIVGYRRLEVLPLVVTAALSEREVLRDWRANLIVYAPLLVVFVFFVGVLMWFFLRELRQREALSAALRENSDRLRLALESSETGTWTWNKATDRSIGDENVHRIFGVAPDAYPGTGEAFLRLVHADDRDNVRRAIESCMADGASYDIVYRIYRGDGAIRWIHSRGEPLRGADGALVGLIGVCHDTTSQRQVQDALVQTQRMEIVSRMTGGIAHDFNNLHQVVLGNAEILIEGLRDDTALRRWAEMTKVAAERGAELTRQLMAFARRQMLDPSKVGVNGLLSSMADKLRLSLDKRTLALDLADDLCLAMVDAGQLETAILSLTLNACEAMPQGGRLSIATANRELSADDCHEDDGLTPGRYVALSFADDGVGMTADVLKRCCEPFFTTKDVGAGSGLGLSMVYGFVKQSDGHMTISSRPGAGTTVTLYLPCADGAPAAAADELPHGPEPSDGRKTVLVVDDEPLVRGYVCRQLSDLGYGVIECADVKAALTALGSAEAIELLFSDINMPGEIDGVGLAEAAVRMRPGIKVLLTSGNPGSFEGEGGDRLAGFDVLAKPYRRAALAAALRRAIDPGSKVDPAP
jgi:PAS domain S-box-containing protein